MNDKQLRKYEVIWEQIKSASNDDPDKWTYVHMSHADQMQTIINMVQLEKSQAHLARKALDLPAYGKLQIKREPAKKQVGFKLNNSGASL